jgi:hypothetical protein
VFAPSPSAAPISSRILEDADTILLQDAAPNQRSGNAPAQSPLMAPKTLNSIHSELTMMIQLLQCQFFSKLSLAQILWMNYGRHYSTILAASLTNPLSALRKPTVQPCRTQTQNQRWGRHSCEASGRCRLDASGLCCSAWLCQQSGSCRSSSQDQLLAN